MQVLRETFAELLPLFEKAVDSADYIAIDTELTGLNRNGQAYRPSSSDDAQARYSKLRSAAQEFLVIQFGACTFTWSSEQNSFIARPFNFYIFPNGEPKQAGDRFFTCSSSSLSFLSSCDFDFNTWIRNGIPYMNLNEEERIIGREGRQDHKATIPIDDSNREFITTTFAEIDTWLQASASDKKRLTIKANNSYFRRLVYQEIAARYNGFVIVENANGADLTLYWLTEDEKLEYLATPKPRMPLNFRQVIQIISDSKKPVIGHNCMTDFISVFRQFWRELPPKVDEWKLMLNNLFETTIDTKHIAATHPKLQNYLPNTRLGTLFEAVSNEPFISSGPKIVFDPSFNRYEPSDGISDKKAYMHEAGYDAFITGSSWLRMAEFVLKEPAGSELPTENDEIERNETTNNPSHVYQTSPELNAFANKIYFMWSEVILYLDLRDKEYPIGKENHFYLSNIPFKYVTNTMHAIFSDLGRISIRWDGDSAAWLIVEDSNQAAQVVEGRLGMKRVEAILENQEEAMKGVTAEAAEIMIERWRTWWDRSYPSNRTAESREIDPSQFIPMAGRELVHYGEEDVPTGDLTTMTTMTTTTLKTPILPLKRSVPDKSAEDDVEDDVEANGTLTGSPSEKSVKKRRMD